MRERFDSIFSSEIYALIHRFWPRCAISTCICLGNKKLVPKTVFLLMSILEHGVQRRMISVVIFFPYFLDYYVLLYCCYMRPSTRCGGYVWPSFIVNSIWKSFLKYE